VVTGLLIVIGICGIYTKGMTLIPESDEGAFTIEVEKEQGTIYQDTLETVESIEAELEDHSEIDIYLSNIGSTQPMSMSEEMNKANITATLVSPDEIGRATCRER